MERKHLAVILGAAMGLSVTVPCSVLAAGTDYSERSGLQVENVQYTVYDTPTESDRQAAAEQGDSLMQLQVSELKGKTLSSPDGTNLGEIIDIVRSNDDQSLHAVVVVGGMLGVSQNRVTYPVGDLQIRDDEIVTATELTEEELDQRTAYNADDYESISDTRQLADLNGVIRSPEGEIASFEEIDRDGDGYISREEAQGHAQLMNAWQDVDVNSDDQIDDTELSAFEAGWEAASEQIQQRDTGTDSEMSDDTGITGEEPPPGQPE